MADNNTGIENNGIESTLDEKLVENSEFLLSGHSKQQDTVSTASKSIKTDETVETVEQSKDFVSEMLENLLEDIYTTEETEVLRDLAQRQAKVEEITYGLRSYILQEIENFKNLKSPQDVEEVMNKMITATEGFQKDLSKIMEPLLKSTMT